MANNASTEIEGLIQRLGGAFPKEVARQASELLRRLAIKCKPGGLGKGEMCRPAVCIELACRQCGHVAVSRESLIQQSMVKETSYRDVLRRAEHALELTASWSAPQFALVLGGEQAVPLAERTLAEYQNRYRSSLQGGGGEARLLSQQSLYVGAAFFLAAKKLKMTVDKKRLLNLSGAQPHELSAVCASMQEFCADLVGTPAKNRRFLLSSTAPTSDLSTDSTRGTTSAHGEGTEDHLLLSSREPAPPLHGLSLSRESSAHSSSSTSSHLPLLGSSGPAQKRSRPNEANPCPRPGHLAGASPSPLELLSSRRAGKDEAIAGETQTCLKRSTSASHRALSSTCAGPEANSSLATDMLRFRNEQDKAKYEEWKVSVRAAAANKERKNVKDVTMKNEMKESMGTAVGSAVA